MRTHDWIRTATQTLHDAGIESARLDALVLLEDALGKDRTLILAHPEIEIDPSTEVELNKKIAQRARHTPLAYIRGKAEFYVREFRISRHVLVPRPETETMIDLLKKLSLPPKPKIADVGTGTGCIGITAALELPGAVAKLYDIDSEALRLAASNVDSLGARASCHKSDLLDGVVAADVIVANLPYVPERYAINQAAEHEPKHAIFGGKDGLNLYRRFWTQIADLTKQPDFVLTEALPIQHEDLAGLAEAAGYRLTDSQDFIQVFMRA